MTESIQKKLLRVRPPRVKITYDVETGGAIEKNELPFKVLHLNKQALQDDFAKSPSFDQSELFKQLYASTYGTYGGESFGLLAADFEISSSAKDIELLTWLSRIAAAAHAPLVVACTAPADAIAKFRKSEDSCFVATTLSIDEAILLAKRIEDSYTLQAWPGALKSHLNLSYLLAACRFTNYIKVIMRGKIGSFLTRGNVESYLNTWISQYVLLDDNASEDVKAALPLRAARVVVTDIAGSPGAYLATIFIKPHFQLEELTTSIRLVAQLPS